MLDVERRLADGGHELSSGISASSRISLDELVVVVRDLLEQVLAGGRGRVGEVLRDVADDDVLAQVVRVGDGLHRDQVDDAGEVALGADRQLDRHGVRAEAVDHGLDAAVEVRADAVHLVDVGDARDAVGVGLAPHGLGLRLDAGDGVEHGDGAIQHAQGALHLDGEVDVAGRVDDVDPVVLPLSRGGRGSDGDAALLLLLHPVHRGGALVDLAHLVGAAGVVEDPLGRRGLTRVDVGHDPDVAGLFESEVTWHGREGGGACEARKRAPMGALARQSTECSLAVAMSRGTPS